MTNNKKHKKVSVRKTDKQIRRNPRSKEEERLDLHAFLTKVHERAYEIFLNRGSKHGNDISDWLQAEAEIKKEYQIE